MGTGLENVRLYIGGLEIPRDEFSALSNGIVELSTIEVDSVFEDYFKRWNSRMKKGDPEFRRTVSCERDGSAVVLLVRDRYIGATWDGVEPPLNTRTYEVEKDRLVQRGPPADKYMPQDLER